MIRWLIPQAFQNVFPAYRHVHMEATDWKTWRYELYSTWVALQSFRGLFNKPFHNDTNNLTP